MIRQNEPRSERTIRVIERNQPYLNPLALSRQATAILAVSALFLWGVAFLLWRQAEVDKWLLISQNGLRTNALVVNAAQLATGYGMPLIVLLYFLYWLFAFRFETLRDAYPIYLLVFLMFGLAGIGGDILKEIFHRPRPFVQYAGELNALSKASTPSFPSGHATKSIALALPFLLLLTAKERWQTGLKVVLTIIVVGVCCSRVVLGAHFVSDVLAGAATALMFVPLATVLSNKILRNMTKERFEFAVKIWGVILLGLMVYLVANL
jgi:membrane-associated phospholipid phosphatase